MKESNKNFLNESNVKETADKVIKFFSDNQNVNTEKILSLGAEIGQISDECEQYKMYEDSKKERESFIEQLDSIEKNEERLMVIWNYIIHRLNDAPNAIYLVATCVLTFPLLNHVVKSF